MRKENIIAELEKIVKNEDEIEVKKDLLELWRKINSEWELMILKKGDYAYFYKRKIDYSENETLGKMFLTDFKRNEEKIKNLNFEDIKKLLFPIKKIKKLKK